MRRGWIRAGVLFVALAAVHPARADDDAIPGADPVPESEGVQDVPANPDTMWRARLTAPLHDVREQAVYDLCGQRADALRLGRLWVSSDLALLREQAWRVLAHAGEVADLHRALAAATSALDGQVVAAAVEAFFTLAARHAPPNGPWLDLDNMPAPQHTRVFALALVDRLHGTSDVPRAILHLGEGTIPWLLGAYHATSDSARVRVAVVRSLGRMACSESRAALAGLTDTVKTERAAWFDALVACGPGPELAPVHKWIATFANLVGRRGRGRWPGWRNWRDRIALYRFLSACPDDRWAEPVRDRMRAILGTSSWHTTVLRNAARVLLVVGNPTDEDLEAIVDASATPRWPRNKERFEGLGEVLATLRPYTSRPAVMRALEDRSGARRMPRTSKAWALVLREAPKAEIAIAANNLLYSKPQLAACLRTGARILSRCGGPSAKQVRDFLEHGDLWMRAWAISWAHRALPADESKRVLQNAAKDSSTSVALVAGERLADIDAVHAGRLLEIALYASSPSLRSRAWRVLEREMRPAGDPGKERQSLPRGDAGLDERLRAAGLVRAWLQKDSSSDHAQVLPTPNGQAK